ncbi:MAG: hypothetical protein A3B25_01090 [Candidatus Ryanbacteria bacterium RIFCSPLOWO2_01_FULL_48_26]|uniref:PEGA domain-containing protein n=1 Tax=Candidatus Ryanbacteria bacterium RIFCSPLOWO2_01_FULL_48_26 TaxID=1802126 RepID=A0A1G2GSA1_9BACT|nr:MAG: hypothetical protein A3B25_01090 [Candidatus Ryanbacteria bacterium RIFCSPLOWO2_01_FULL_48_26]
MNNTKRSRLLTGFSLIDLVISMGIIVLLFGGIFLVYSAIVDSARNNSTRTAALSVLEQQSEIIRNLPYDSVGTQNGIPTGIIPQTQTVAVAGQNFTVRTTVRNIDDPFDGTLGGVPNDTAPADYKLVWFEAQCTQCARPLSYFMTTTVAPINLESASTNGSLFINIINASGKSVSNVDVHVVNASVTPAIDLTDTTNASGVLQLVGVPTSTQSYAVTAIKSGYTSEKTYPPGDPSNPNPINLHATVAAGTVSEVTLTIDETSDLNVKTSESTCVPTGNKNFSISGGGLIGLNPDVPKYSTSSATNAEGLKTFTDIDFGTYALTLDSPSSDLIGMIPLSPFTVDPSSTYDFRFVTRPANPLSLLVVVKDSVTGAGVNSSTVNLSKSGFSETVTTGRDTWTDTDWSGGQYGSQDGGIEADSPAGSLSLVSSGGTYSTTTVPWLISNTIDVGSSTATYYDVISWNPASQPAQTGSESVRFQIASNNDQTTWNFVGPDGTAGTYYAATGDAIYAGHENNRYLRYKAFLKTEDENYTPEVNNVSIDFYSVCVPLAQAFFAGLSPGTYSVDVTAPGYQEATSTVSVTANWQQTQVILAP